jgi:hypothetical protein
MPGALFPADRPRHTSSEAERDVYDALKRQLPEGWCAWHSLKLRVHGSKWESEADFVIAVPHRGMLLLEVKGGEVELRDGRWFQGSREIKSPRDQAQTFAKNLQREVEKLGGGKVPFGIACVFPDVPFSEGPECGDLRGAVIGKRELAYLAEALPKLVDELIPRWPVPEDSRWHDALTRLWGKTWKPSVALRDRVDDASRTMIALDAEQLRVLDLAGENPRAKVEGAAGTGKTVVARELCLRRAAEGQRVLYLCYTESLAREIEAQLRESGLPPEQVRAVAVRQFARELTGEADPPPSADALEFWETVCLRALPRLAGLDPRPDCVVVDEAQDLAAADWRFVEALAGDGGLWLFHDPRQAFWKERSIPKALGESLPSLKLQRQQRCPDAIALFAERFASPDAPAALPTDRTALQLVIGEEAELLPRLTATLDRLIDSGVRPQEIAILSLGGQKRSALQHLDHLGAHVLARADSPLAQRAVVADTFLRFKGLERPFVVIAELEGGLGHKFDTRMHIALTRATVGVHLLCTPAERDRDPRLQSLASG